jgi:hypothetical protein
MIKTIKTDQYWFLIDTNEQSSILAGKWVIDKTNQNITTYNPNMDGYPKFYSIILAHLPIGDAPLLEGVPELPKQEEEWTEEDDRIYELAISYGRLGDTPEARHFEDGFMEGYKVASQGRMYSEVDMLKMAAYISGRYSIRNTQREVEDGEVLGWVKDYLKSLSPVQQWEFEPEWEYYSKPEDGHSAIHKEKRLKIINNIVQGKWKRRISYEAVLYR